MRKVLVLEDEENIRSFVVINLKRAGYQTVEAGSIISRRATLISGLLRTASRASSPVPASTV